MSDIVDTIHDEQLDDWVLKPSGPVALRLKQKLLPVEESNVIFPPTYADIGYNIDVLSDGMRVATVDSIGSQANRMEPIFRCESKDPNDWLVPQIQIVLREEPCGECDVCRSPAGKGRGKSNGCKQPRLVRRGLLDLAHRAADAVVQSSPDLLEIIQRAFRELQQGNAGSLCTIAPTSLVFGVWDSRGDSGEKRPRLVRSVIRAWDVEPMHAAAQFNSVWKFLDEEDQNELKSHAKAQKVDLSEKGFADAPATFRKTKSPQYVNGAPNPEARVLGGVLVRGEIVREVTVNLVALRGLCGSNEKETADIRRYLLGLCLVAATAEMEPFLREGCLLRYADGADQWLEIPRRGEPRIVALSAAVAMKYARDAAAPFRAKWPATFGAKFPELDYRFDLRRAKDLLSKKGAEETPAE